MFQFRFRSCAIVFKYSLDIFSTAIMAWYSSEYSGLLVIMDFLCNFVTSNLLLGG